MKKLAKKCPENTKKHQKNQTKDCVTVNDHRNQIVNEWEREGKLPLKVSF
jgi:hypothetical protein